VSQSNDSGPSKATVVVTDGEQRAALAAVRSLGRAGYSVHACSARKRSLAGSSRYSSTSTTVADPLREPGAYVDELVRLTGCTNADVLLPVSEASLLAVLPERDRFDCIIPFADEAAFRRVCDKSWVLDTAKKHDIAVPAQVELRNVDDASRLLGDAGYPLVLKPYRSLAGENGELMHVSVTYASSPHALESALQKIPASAYPVLAQQRIEGPGFAISVLVWKGELLAAFAHRRIREKPPSGGVSVLRESIPLDEELLAKSLALLAELAWEGVAMVEFKLDRRTGIPYLMEINGRLWGSLQLAIDAGVDFPSLLVSAALGGNPEAVVQYPPDVRSRWEWGDVDHLLASMFRSRASLSLPASSQRHLRLHSVTQFLRSFASDDVPEVFRRDDPRPFFRETMNWFRGQ
jgi:predicted ATP-grasp superfamily ATP-dependent carboligase